MKSFNILPGLRLAVAALAAVFSFQTLQATPYASCITNDASTVGFRLNESGGSVTVTYEDGTTNASFDGLTTGTNLAKGAYVFSLSGHNGYAIAVAKTGAGTPSLISADTNTLNRWNSPRGVDVNKNAKNAALFGRVYVGNSTPGGTAPNNKGRGIFAINADLSDSPLGSASAVNGVGGGIFVAGGASGPWRLRVLSDGTVLVNDFSTANASLWQFAPDLSSSNLVLGTVGQVAAANAGIHGDMFGTPVMTGSLAASNLVLWTFDSGMAAPAGTTLGPGTSVGSYNCAFRYDIGAGPLPWTNKPNFAYTMGLDGIAELRTEGDIGMDGKIICGFGRGNLSNPDLQILNTNGTSVLWTSWIDSGGASDPWNGSSTAAGQVGTYGGVRVSPDGLFIASVDINNGITVANLTNGIPDNSSIFAIPQPALGVGTAGNNYVGNSRGIGWDAADNLYVCSSGQGLLRVFSLGNSSVCVSSNDVTGTNGTFRLVLPPVAATVATTTPQASQNYGTPVPGVLTISLTTNILAAPVIVSFTKSGTAAYLTNYTLNLGTDANGVIISSNTVTFPTGAYPGAGNWKVDVQIIPTPIPVSGPTLTATLRVLGGANYLAGTPPNGTVSIVNTGPQLLILSVATNSASMSRGIQNDYAKFVITRYGDSTVAAYTITNFTYLGTAIYPADYTANAQRYAGAILNDGAPGIVINPGDVVITNAVGNPVAHGNFNLAPTNVTIILSLTNLVTGANATSLEGYAYGVSTNSVTLTEFDNAIGPELVLWSNPLTNSADSTNWTLTFASQGLATSTVLPVVVPNYTNGASSLASGGTNDFTVNFGHPVASDGVPQSAYMAANGLNNALKMTVNKASTSAAGVNLYPQGKKFQGNYALRFSMYLSLYSGAINNPYAGSYPREFAAFGINHGGTNCNWRLATPIGATNPGNGTTNADGIWFAIDAGDNSATPADFDAFTPGNLPNAGVLADRVSLNGIQNSGIFKNPPFTTMTPAGGEPVNQWVDVSVEVTRQTNCTLYMNRAAVLSSFSITNGSPGYTNGTIMLGYLDPVANISDSSAFVYYSNVRVVELSPYISAQPLSLIVTQGSSISFTSSATFATSPVTNIWNLANTNPAPVFALQTDAASATNLTSILVLNNVQSGTNYVAVFSDPAGSVTGVVASLEVVIGPASQTVNAGTNFVQFTVTPNGPATPAYQWKTNGVNLVNGAHFAGVTTGTLTITNAQLSDAVIYSVAMTNTAGGSLTLSAALAVIAPPPTISSVSLVGTNAVLGLTTPNGQDNAGSFTLQSSVTVQGPYTNTPGTVTGANGAFLLTVPLTTNNTMFYRVKHN